MLCENCNRFLELIVSSDYFKCFACNKIKERIKTEIIRNLNLANSSKSNSILLKNLGSNEALNENNKRINNQNNFNRNLISIKYFNKSENNHENGNWGADRDQVNNCSPIRNNNFTENQNNDRWNDSSHFHNQNLNFNCNNNTNYQNSNYWDTNNNSEKFNPENQNDSNVNNFSDARNSSNNNDFNQASASNGFYVNQSKTNDCAKNKTFYSSNDKMQIEEENVFSNFNNNLNNENCYNSFNINNNPQNLFKNGLIRNNFNSQASNFIADNNVNFQTNPQYKAEQIFNNFSMPHRQTLNLNNNLLNNFQSNNCFFNNNNQNSNNKNDNENNELHKSNLKNLIYTPNKSENISMKIVTSEKENRNLKYSNFKNNFSLLGSKSKFNDFHINSNNPAPNKNILLTNSKFAKYNLTEEQFKRNIESPSNNKKLMFLEQKEIHSSNSKENENLNSNKALKSYSETPNKSLLDNDDVENNNINNSVFAFQNLRNNNPNGTNFANNNFFNSRINNNSVNPNQILNCDRKSNYSFQSIIFNKNNQYCNNNNNNYNNQNSNNLLVDENQRKCFYNSVNANEIPQINRSVKPLNISIIKENTKNHINSKSSILNKSVDSSFFDNDEVREKCLNSNNSFFEDYLN